MLTAECNSILAVNIRTELMPEKNIFVNKQSEQPLPEALHLEPKVTKVVPGFPMLIADKSSKSAQLVPLFNPA